MNTLIEWLPQPAAQRVGWTLLHFLWQGAAVAALFALLRNTLRARSAQARYLAGCLSLLLMAAAPVVTFMSLQPAPVSTVASAAPQPARVIAPVVSAGPAVQRPAEFGDELLVFWGRYAEFTETLLPWVVSAWLAGVLLLSSRLLLSWLAVQRLRRRQTEPIEPLWMERLDELKERLGITRPVRLLKSALVQVPSVIGWFRPVILLPASSLTELSPTQLELVLAHELAHIRRHDHWVNLLQIAVETLLFYHPAVWWVSGCVREEREHCCDDLAVRVCGNRVAYAHALATLEELRGAMAPMALAASGGSLLQRVRRVLGLPADDGSHNSRVSVGPIFFGLGLVMMVAGLVHLLASPKVYRSTVRMMNMTAADVRRLNDRSYLRDSYLFKRELESIRSRTLLLRVIEKLNLNNQWAAKHGQKGKLQSETTCRILFSKLEVRQSRDPGLIEIGVVSDEPAEAALIANNIAEIYSEIRRQNRLSSDQATIDFLKTLWAEKDKAIREKQSEVNKFRDQFRVSDLGGSHSSGAPALEPGTQRKLHNAHVEAKARLAQTAAMYDVLRMLPRGRLKEAVLVAMPEARLGELLRSETEARQKLLDLAGHLGAEHSDVKAIRKVFQTVTNQIAERLDGLLLSLKVKVDSLNAEADSLRKQVEANQDRDMSNAHFPQPYFEAKRDLETLEELREMIQKQIAFEEIATKISRNIIVDVVNPAEPALRPIRPNPALVLATIVMPGALISLVGLVLLVLSRFASPVSRPA